MQYVGQTKRKLKERFREHFNNIKKPKQIDTFLYKHFAPAGNSFSPDKIMLQPVEEMILILILLKDIKIFSDMKPNVNG